jgi:hypothetical protein
MRRWIVAAVVLALAVGAAVAYAYAAPKRYDAISRVVVHPVPAGDNTLAGIDVLRDSQDEAPIMATAAAYFTTPDVVAAAADALGTTPGALRGHLAVRPLTGSNVLQVIGKDDDGRRAAEIANAVRQAGIAQRTARFQAQLAAALDKVGNLDSVEARRRVVDLHALQGRPDPTLESLTVATAPEDAAWPDRDVVIPAGVGIGLGLAALIGLLPPLLRPGRGRVDEHRERELAGLEQELARREQELAAGQEELGDREQALRRRADAITQREGELAAAVEEARAATADEARVARRAAEVATREQGLAREAAELKQRERTLHEEEQALAGRASLVDDRALRSAARSAELDARARELRDRAEALVEHERELHERAQSLAQREGDLGERLEAILQRERELAERETTPPPESEPEPHPPGGWTIHELDRAVAQHADEYPERLEEWRYYLHFLRGHADVDGRLPATFHDLVDETFADALVDASPEL